MQTFGAGERADVRVHLFNIQHLNRTNLLRGGGSHQYYTHSYISYSNFPDKKKTSRNSIYAKLFSLTIIIYCINEI